MLPRHANSNSTLLTDLVSGRELLYGILLILNLPGNTGNSITGRIIFVSKLYRGMVSRENKVFYVLGAVALVVFLLLVGFTDLPSWANTAVLFVVGIFLPLFINDYLDRTEA